MLGPNDGAWKGTGGDLGIFQQLDKQGDYSPPSACNLRLSWPTRTGQGLGLAAWAYLQRQSISAISHYIAPERGIISSRKGAAEPASAGGNSLYELGLEE